MPSLKTLLFISLCFVFISPCYADYKTRVEYEKPNNSTELAVKNELNASGTVEAVIDFINSEFRLPEPLVFLMGGDDGPLYDPEQNTIMIPYSFMIEIADRFTQVNYKQTGVSEEQAAQDALMHTLFHEFAHAMIFMNDIPIVGKEEDAADNLATVLLIEYFENGQEIALSAADLFDLESDDRNELTDEYFWDEHSLDEQRYFSTLCHVYGSDEKAYGFILEETQFTDDRADFCIAEYENISRSWLALLEPYFIKQ